MGVFGAFVIMLFFIVTSIVAVGVFVYAVRKYYPEWFRKTDG